MEIQFKDKVVLVSEENINDLLNNAWAFDNHNYLSNRSNINDRFHRYIMRNEIKNFCDKHRINITSCKIDHINGDVLDNRLENLRCVTHSDNLMNRPKQSNNKSGYKGICITQPYNKKYYNVSLQYKKISYKKCFSTLEEAIEWRNKKILDLNINEERNIIIP